MSSDKVKEMVEKIKASMPSNEERMALYQQYKKDLQQSLYYFTDENFFIGNLLQEFDVKCSEQVPTAAMAYDKKKQSFHMLINPYFFVKGLPTLGNKIAVLHHEILHFTNKHFFRFEMLSTDGSKEDHKRANISTDLAINQYISHLPEGCLDVKYFATDKGVPFESFQTAEVYYQLLKDNPDAMKNAQKKMQKEGKLGEGEGLDTLDEHEWDNLTEDEKKQMADEMRKLLKRTLEKTSHSKSKVPDSIKDLLQEIETFIQSLNYKAILAMAIKKHASSSERSHTWNRPNKRYGNIAPGTKNGKLPKLSFYVDTSGSISVVEMNQFLRVIDGFLAVGERKCELNLWHTSLYKKMRYKKNQLINPNDVESGGTDLTSVVNDVNKNTPDLAIILTDGYYHCDATLKSETVFIISEGGDMNHSMSKKYKSIPLKGLTK